MNTMNEFTGAAQGLIGQLVQEDFSGAYKLFDGKLAQALPEDRLKETWHQILSQFGAFQSILNLQEVEIQGHQNITATCQFENTVLDIRIMFNPDGQVGGLNVQLGASNTPYQPPAYVNMAAFQEVELTVGSGDWALPATLSLPNGMGPFPSVVLVHGSGPQDRDETIGPNKVFRDLAWGLASQGIAVLRYEKRTKAHAARYTPEMIARITTQDEVIDDALAAVQLLRRTPGIDPQRIYVLGHSLGATLAPRIGQQDPGITGLIALAGITRTFEDTILDQFTYLANLSGTPSELQKADLEQLKEKVARVKDPNLSLQTQAEDLPLGIHPAYWLDLRGYQPAELAKSLDMPIFVLQGGRDYQVTAADDFPAWQKALAHKSNATLKLYPKLYHLFIEGEGPSTPQEYYKEGHVSTEVIQDIAGWIKGQPGK